MHLLLPFLVAPSSTKNIIASYNNKCYALTLQVYTYELYERKKIMLVLHIPVLEIQARKERGNKIETVMG